MFQAFLIGPDFPTYRPRFLVEIAIKMTFENH